MLSRLVALLCSLIHDNEQPEHERGAQCEYHSHEERSYRLGAEPRDDYGSEGKEPEPDHFLLPLLPPLSFRPSAISVLASQS